MIDLPAPKIPSATYRLQLNCRFTFRDAARIAGYLHDLGVSDIYASPFFKAKPGSMHGYDIVDHTALNPEIGTEKSYRALIDELRMLDMGLVLDIVPNHMCIESPENRWWADVLENGSASPYAGYFDIDWSPVKKELQNKVLIPFLGDQYGKVLEGQELQLVFEEGAFFVSYYEHKFPLLPRTYVPVLVHRLDALKKRLAAEDPDLAELLSIITALEYLPSYSETDAADVEERIREKEVIKQRLHSLAGRNTDIREHIEANVGLFNGAKGAPKSFDLLDDLINRQVYRLSHWRVATEEINYRRFFDINGLAAIRVEKPEVFAAAHSLAFQFVRDGSVTGLRVDHPDGLYNPVEYFHWLQRGCFIQLQLERDRQADAPDDPPLAEAACDTEAKQAQRYDQAILDNPEYKPFYIVGEKILTKGERMPPNWPIFSTTGYVFLNSVNGIFVDGEQAKAFDRIYEQFIRRKISFQDIVYEKKKLVMQVAMASEINTLGRYLSDISEKNRHTRDFTLNSLRRVIVEVLAAFPVYRTYINGYHVTDRDKQYIDVAVSRAKRRNPAISESVFDFLKDVLLLRFPPGLNDEEKSQWLYFVMRFQQLSGPVMAKGYEDTALSVYNRLVSLNEVGGAPDKFGTLLETFHGQNIERAKSWPHALIATSTHDTKRSEDVRARINVLSEIPHEWGRKIKTWALLNRRKKISIEGEKAPDRNDEYLLYQTLVGVWPVEMPGGDDYARFVQRIKDYMLKEAREAKVNTSWINSNKAYEDALLAFTDAILASPEQNQFLKDLLPFQRIVSYYGMFNSLSQTLLKVAAPGVPDFYQGTDLWDYSLVDPDNRRPVDYIVRIKMLDDLKVREKTIPAAVLCRELTENKVDGRIMLYLLYKALNFRRAHRHVFEKGEYIALETDGRKFGNVVAFERKYNDMSAITVVPRFLSQIVSVHEMPLGKDAWDDTVLILADMNGEGKYRNIFTGANIVARRCSTEGKTALLLSDIFADFPVALLERME